MKRIKKGLLVSCMGTIFVLVIVAAFVVSRLYLFAGIDAGTQAAYNERLDVLRKKNAATIMEFDRYGGWINAPESFGEPQPGDYFRVAKRNGAWWFITPDGHPFVSKGVTDVHWLGATLSPGPYQNILRNKYASEEVWAHAAFQRIQEWGFNTVGPWSSASMTPLLPHSIIILDAAGHAPRYANAIVTDVWSDDFANNVITVAQQRAAPYVDDKNLLGYFLDNELVWDEDHFHTNKTLLQLYVEFPADAAGRAEALLFARNAAGTLEKFNETWGTTITDWAQIQNLSSRNLRVRNESAQTVSRDFSIAAFHRYASLAIAALRSVDPNHLILGCRYHTYPGDEMIRAAAQYFDVISMAAYAQAPPVKEIDAIYNDVDKPFLIEEWSFKARGTRLLNIQMYAPVVRNQYARALAYDAYVETFMRRPYAVGYHWYKWMDNPWEGVKDIIRGDNFGLMTARDVPYEPFVNFISEVNRRVEIWHAN